MASKNLLDSGAEPESTRIDTCPSSPLDTAEAPGRETFNALRKLPFFALFDSDDELEYVLGHGSWLQFPAKRIILHEGSAEPTLHVLVCGKARVYKGKTAVGEIQPPEVFGEIGAFLQRPRATSVMASANCTVFRINVEQLKKFNSETLFSVMEYLFKLTAQRLVDADERLCR